MELVWTCLAAFFSGAAASLGIGGGGILLLYLVLVLHEEQLVSQGINLLFFIPCGLVSIVMYTKKHLIEWKAAIPIIIGGVCGVGIGIWIASALQEDYLSKIFGGFLILLGLRELFSKQAQSVTQKNYK